MIDLHFIPSPNGRKVSIMLEEVGLSYNLIPYEILKGDHLTREFRRINPNARLPAIVDHDPIGGGEPLAVFESGAILLYLAEEYSVADIACWPWIGGIRAIGWDVADYPHIRRWFEAIGRRPAVIEGSKHLAPSQVAGGKANLTPEQWSNVFGAKMLANSLTD